MLAFNCSSHNKISSKENMRQLEEYVLRLDDPWVIAGTVTLSLLLTVALLRAGYQCYHERRPTRSSTSYIP